MLKSRIAPEEEVAPATFAIEHSTSLRWAVARAWAGKERKAIEDLTNAGFFAYSPRGSEIAYRTVGRSSGLERQVRYVRSIRPFGAYIFVGQLSRSLGKSVSRHLVDVLGDENGPLALSSAAIRAIASAHAAGEWDHDKAKSKLSTAFKLGQRVMIKDGPFDGFLGIVRSLRGELRYQIEAEIFSRPTPLLVEACQIAAV